MTLINITPLTHDCIVWEFKFPVEGYPECQSNRLYLQSRWSKSKKDLRYRNDRLFKWVSV